MKEFLGLMAIYAGIIGLIWVLYSVLPPGVSQYESMARDACARLIIARTLRDDKAVNEVKDEMARDAGLNYWYRVTVVECLK